MTSFAREYAPGDLDGCLAVFDTNVPEFFLAVERVDFERFLSHLPGPYVVLEEAGRIVACGGYALRPSDRTADLCWGMVRRDRQGSGLGRRLLEERLGLLRREPGAREVVLRTGRATTAFYERFGFVTERTVADGIAPGVDLFVMRLSDSAARASG